MLTAGRGGVEVRRRDGGATVATVEGGRRRVLVIRTGRIVSSSFHGNRPVPDWYLMNPDGTGVHSLPQLRGAGDPIDWLVPVR